MNRTMFRQMVVQASPSASLFNGSPKSGGYLFYMQKKTLPRQGFYYAKSG